MKTVRLLANLGYGSRKQVAALLRDGRVTDDAGQPLAADAVIAHARIRVDGEPLDPPPGVLLMLHKPPGVTCSRDDIGPLVLDLLPSRFARRRPLLASVGRLDRDTSGLLLLTDDGGLNHRIVAPRAHVAKSYEAILAADLRGDEAALFASGTLMLKSEAKPLAPARLQVLGPRHVRLTLHEGRYHQVRRMFAATATTSRRSSGSRSATSRSARCPKAHGACWMSATSRASSPHPTTASTPYTNVMKIASWNVNSLKVRLPHLTQWLAQTAPAIVALQETKLEDDKFPHDELAAAGYRAVCSGQKTYNGVAILSREEARDVVTDIDGLDDPQRRILAATIGETRIIDLYVVNGKEVGSDKYDYKLRWLAAVRNFIEAELKRHPKLVVLGDFNIARDDRDVYAPAEWQGRILCSPPERAALQALLDLGLTDSFRQFSAERGQFSWWDYRAGAFARNLGLRIDLILLSAALKSAATSATIDPEPRLWERPSDHTPVLVELQQPA